MSYKVLNKFLFIVFLERELRQKDVALFVIPGLTRNPVFQKEVTFTNG